MLSPVRPSVRRVYHRTRKLCYSKDDRAMRAIWPFEIIQDGGSRHLEFVGIENSAIRSAVPENLTL